MDLGPGSRAVKFSVYVVRRTFDEIIWINKFGMSGEKIFVYRVKIIRYSLSVF